MKISVFYHHIREAARQQHCQIREILPVLRESGYTGVELDLNDCEDVGALKVMLQENGLKVSNICCFFSFAEQKEEERIDRLIRTAVELETARVMPVPGFYPEGMDLQEAGKAITEGLSVLCRKAFAAGLQVSLEDFDNEKSPICTVEGMKYFADRIEGLGYTFDTGNFAYMGEDVSRAFEVLKDKIIHVHCKDRSLIPDEGHSPLITPDGRYLYACSFGAGFLPTRQIVRSLKGISYKGWYTVEHFGTDDYLEAMKRSAAFLTQELSES